MIVKNILLIALTTFAFTTAKAQGNFTINGTVKDSLTGETLIGVNIYSK